MGQMGSELGQRLEMWLNCQHFLHCGLLEEGKICSTLRFLEKRMNEGRRAGASGGGHRNNHGRGSHLFTRFRVLVMVMC